MSLDPVEPPLPGPHPQPPVVVVRHHHGGPRTLAAAVVLGAVAAIGGIGLIPPARGWVGPVRITADASPGFGRTTLAVPPLGRVSASTHLPPLEMELAVSEVDASRLARLLTDRIDPDRLLREVEPGLRRVAVGLAIRLLVGGLLIGAAVAAIVSRRRPAAVVLGAAAGTLSVAAVLTVTAVSFEPEAFERPRFTGALERAPDVLEALQRDAGALRSRFSRAAASVAAVIGRASEPLADPHAGTVALLHVSDVHANPLGLELTRRLAERFRVDAIVDSGDVTSFGEPLEANLLALLDDMPAPYLIVPGNHDSPEIRDALGRIEGVRVLDGSVVDVSGVQVLGVADPSFTAGGDTSTEEHNRAVDASAGVVSSSVAAFAPDVLVVHHPAHARESFGLVPLVLAGHRHKPRMDERGGTRLLEVGSTGATGLGSFLVESDRPYEAQVVYLRDRVLVARDYVRVRQLGSDVEVRRITFGS